VDAQDRENKKAALRRSAQRNEDAGRWLDAAQDWISVLQIDPRDAAARRALDKTQERLSAPLRAAPLPTAPAARPAPEAPAPRNTVEAERLYTRGLSEYAEGRLEKARNFFRQALMLDPDHGYALRALQRVEDEIRAKGR